MEPNVVLSCEKEENPVVVFIHVPKTGGTTLRYFLQKRFRRSLRVKNVKNLQRRFLCKPLKQRNQFDFISGHIPTGVIHQAVSRPCVYLTQLRDPLARAVSDYNRILRLEIHRWHKRFIQDGITPEKFLTRHDDLRDCLLDNPVTRRFSDPSCTYDARPITPGLISRVKETLREQFAFIGLAERSADSIFLLSRKLGPYKITPRHYLSRNVTRRPDAVATNLSREIVARFKELNAADYEIYDYARQTFERQWDGLDARERKQARRFRMVQNAFGLFTYKSSDLSKISL